MLNTLIRSYYEQHGNFDNIMSSSFCNLLVKENITKDDLYKSIGFNSEEEYKGFVKSIEIDLTDKDKLNKYIKLLTKYLLSDKNLVRGHVDFLDTVNRMLKMDTQSLVHMLQDTTFLNYLDTLVPAWKYVEGCNPCIQHGVLYSCDKLSDRQKLIILQSSIKNILFGYVDFGDDNIAKLKRYILNPLTFSYGSGYEFVLRLSIKHNLTMREVIELSNLNYVDFIEQWNTHRCCYYLEHNNENEICICAYNENTGESARVIIDKVKFESIYTGDYLDYISVVDGEVVVTKGTTQPITEIM